eukprot:203180_1
MEYSANIVPLTTTTFEFLALRPFAMSRRKTKKEKCYTVTQHLSLKVDPSSEDAYTPAFRLRVPITVPSNVTKINKDTLSFSNIIAWKATNKSRKVDKTVVFRDLSIAEAFRIHSLLLELISTSESFDAIQETTEAWRLHCPRARKKAIQSWNHIKDKAIKGEQHTDEIKRNWKAGFNCFWDFLTNKLEAIKNKDQNEHKQNDANQNNNINNAYGDHQNNNNSDDDGSSSDEDDEGSSASSEQSTAHATQPIEPNDHESSTQARASQSDDSGLMTKINDILQFTKRLCRISNQMDALTHSMAAFKSIMARCTETIDGYFKLSKTCTNIYDLLIQVHDTVVTNRELKETGRWRNYYHLDMNQIFNQFHEKAMEVERKYFKLATKYERVEKGRAKWKNKAYRLKNQLKDYQDIVGTKRLRKKVSKLAVSHRHDRRRDARMESYYQKMGFGADTKEFVRRRDKMWRRSDSKYKELQTKSYYKPIIDKLNRDAKKLELDLDEALLVGTLKICSNTSNSEYNLGTRSRMWERYTDEKEDHEKKGDEKEEDEKEGVSSTVIRRRRSKHKNGLLKSYGPSNYTIKKAMCKFDDDHPELQYEVLFSYLFFFPSIFVCIERMSYV